MPEFPIYAYCNHLSNQESTSNILDHEKYFQSVIVSMSSCPDLRTQIYLGANKYLAAVAVPRSGTRRVSLELKLTGGLRKTPIFYGCFSVENKGSLIVI
jgi:hypothetical protein